VCRADQRGAHCVVECAEALRGSRWWNFVTKILCAQVVQTEGTQYTAGVICRVKNPESATYVCRIGTEVRSLDCAATVIPQGESGLQMTSFPSRNHAHIPLQSGSTKHSALAGSFLCMSIVRIGVVVVLFLGVGITAAMLSYRATVHDVSPPTHGSDAVVDELVSSPGISAADAPQDKLGTPVEVNKKRLQYRQEVRHEGGAANAPSAEDASPSPVQTVSHDLTFVVGAVRYPASSAFGTTVHEVMDVLAAESTFTFGGREFSGIGFFLEEIDGVRPPRGKYWMLYVNGTLAPLGVSQLTMSPGDVFEFVIE
jgi:hypothetical protein